MKEYYLDFAATSRIHPEVLKAMEPYFLEKYGNPSSLHLKGEEANNAIQEARKNLAKEINAKPQEIIFTSGATESNNMALKGLWKSEKKKIIISSIEHPSIKETANFLKEVGVEIDEVPVNNEGLINLTDLKNKIGNKTVLVSIIHVNNIIGVIQNIYDIGKLCKEKNVLFHTDATQSFGKLSIDVKKMNISLLSASSHKIGGPKGTGLLYVNENVKLEPMMHGGGQERGLRSGTENIHGIVGFEKALEVFKNKDKNKIRKVRDLFMEKLEKIGGKINGSKEKRIYDNLHVSFPGIENETLVQFLSHKGIYVSAGSACDSKKEKEDHILKAIGLDDEEIKGSIRITIDEDIEEKDINYLVSEIDKAVKKLTLKN